MDPNYNNTIYFNYIEDKYEKSEKNYKIILNNKENNPEKYLLLYESMNVYPVYPQPIIMPLKKLGEEYTINLNPNNKLKIDLSRMKNMTNKVNEKIIEFNSLIIKGSYTELKSKSKVRRFFDYEIRDAVKNKLNNNNISNAWIKMYEILNTYDLLQSKSNTIDTFHICEHPGGFIHAIKYYIKNILNKEHDFVFQSLKPESDPQIFRPDQELMSKYSNKLDYGVKKGDITDSENILYYFNKYKDRKFNLITSDCGLGFSENFVGQESGLYKVFLGALITAIGVSSQNSNYVFKMFSFNDKKTIELLQITCLFYERVDLVRTLTTKSGSGENYCVCLNYNFKGDKKETLKKLTNYLNNDDDKFVLDHIEKSFLERIYDHHNLITMRRITTMNSLIFRYHNYQYVNNNIIIVSYVKNYVDYYVNYYLTYIKLNQDKEENIPFKLL